jgi:hypothetical protein
MLKPLNKRAPLIVRLVIWSSIQLVLNAVYQRHMLMTAYI